MDRENIRVTNLAHLAALKLAKDWEEYDRWGRVDRWLVGLWVVLLGGSFLILVYWYLIAPTVLPILPS